MAAVKDPVQVASRMGMRPKRTTLLMCKPQFLSTDIPNNVFMQGREEADVPRAMNQWDRVAHILESFGCELYEIPPEKGCQDQTYTANVCSFIHPFAVMAKYKAPGRDCEIEPAKKFLQEKGYNCIQPDDYFEGEADLKLWKPGMYFGGYGLFSTNEAFDWIEKKCGVEIIRLHEINPKGFHLDCELLVIDDENFMVTKNSLAPESIARLQKLGNVIFTPDGCDTCGCTNGIFIREKHLYLSGAFNPEIPEYRKASEWLLEEMDKYGYTVVFVDVDSYNASGADLSCTAANVTF